MKLGLSVKKSKRRDHWHYEDYREALFEYVWNGFEANATLVANE